jgi:ABC-type glycerol-3-phosphate transport system permease component
MIRLKSLVKMLFSYLFLIITSIIVLIPIFWSVLNSFKGPIDILSSPPLFYGFKIVTENYLRLFFEGYPHPNYHVPIIASNILNSIVVSLGGVVLGILIGFPAAYSLARLKTKGAKNIGIWILSTRIFPPIALVIPLYLMLKFFNLLDNIVGLILVYTLTDLPFIIWMLKGFIEELPEDLEESAMIDGCSRLSSLVRVLLPLTAPGIAATSIFCFIINWNELLFALSLTYREAKTFPVITTYLASHWGIAWEQMNAIAVIGIIPAICFTIIAQKYIVRGLALGGVKR